MEEILKNFFIIATLTLGITEIFKQQITDVNTKLASIIIAFVLALATGTGILEPLTLTPSAVLMKYIPQLAVVGLFEIVDLLTTTIFASVGSNKLFDLFVKK